MPIIPLNQKLFVAPQINAEDIKIAQSLGIQTLICNRPDNEEPDQPDFSEISRLANEAGIEYVLWLPVVAPNITAVDGEAFATLLESHPSPALAYCRTGTRSTLLWAMHEVFSGQQSVDAAIARAAEIGINLEPFRERLNATSA